MIATATTARKRPAEEGFAPIIMAALMRPTPTRKLTSFHGPLERAAGAGVREVRRNPERTARPRCWMRHREPEPHAACRRRSSVSWAWIPPMSMLRSRGSGRRLPCGFQVATAESLPFPDESFDAAMALLVLQEFADPVRAAREMARTTRRGGRIAASLWDFVDGMPMTALFWRAAEAVAPEMVARRKAERQPCTIGLKTLNEFWTEAGLSQVRTAKPGAIPGVQFVRRLLAAVPFGLHAALCFRRRG